MDLNTPSSPKTLAKLDGDWAWGAMNDGIFYGVSSGKAGKGILGKKALSNAALVNDTICGESCNLELPTDPQLAILSVEGEVKVTQGHGYDISGSKNHDLNASSCYPVSIPVNGKSNETPVYFRIAIQHPDSILFQGLCLIAKTKEGETDILINQTMDRVLLKPDDKHPSTDTNGVQVDYYLLNAAMQRGIKSNLYHKTALDLSYQLIAYGKTPAGQVVRSNLKVWSSSEKIAWHQGDEVPLWPLYWAEATGAKEYDLGNKERWCAAGVFRFLANPANASLIVPYGAISKEHGGRPRKHKSHQLGTDVDFENPGADVLTPTTQGSAMHDEVARLLSEAKNGNKDSLQKLKRWIDASRARLQGFINEPTVGQVFFGAKKNASIISVLIGGDDDLGIGPWKKIDKLDKYKSNLNDDKKGGTHWNHFHVTFDPRYISQEK